MKFAKNILEIIGNTPLVQINKLNPNKRVTILAKLEYLNPGGSIKDRAALEMISRAEKAGKLKKNSTLVEATSGNTGIGLAMVSAVKGYKAIFTQPDWMSKNKKKFMEAFGATIVTTPTALAIDDPRSYKSTAKRIAKEKKAFLVDQYSNRGNPDAHYKTTGPEIWEATEGEIDVLVAGIGTGGTINGIARYLKEKNPKIKIVVVDPEGSIISGGKMGPFLVEGIGHIFFADNVDTSRVDEFITVKSTNAIKVAKDIIRLEGIPAGPSSGAILYGAQQIAKKAKNGAVIVALFPDSGERYLDYLYNDTFEVPLPKKHETKQGFATKAIHAHLKAYQEKKALVPPITRSAIYTFSSVDEAAKIFEGSNKDKENRSKYVYARGLHPNQRHLEQMVTDLEGSHGDAVAFASGMAAITAFTQTVLSQGDHVVASNVLYGDSFHLFGSLVKKWGINTTFVDFTNPKTVAATITKKTKLLYTETPTNPLLGIIDIEQIGIIAKEHGVLFAVDNTFASPYLQQPLRLGADVVIESTTKYLSGHSDALGGIVIANDEGFIKDLWGTLFVTGAVIDPQAAWLTTRGIKTLALRMEKHCSNAITIARFLEHHPKIAKVHYPGLISHPQHDLARTQMNGFGGIISFELRGGVEEGKRMVNALLLFSLSVSLGAVESLINHPASMTHKVIPRQDRLKGGISDGLVRLSIGIEDVQDLITDLQQALEKV